MIIHIARLRAENELRAAFRIMGATSAVLFWLAIILLPIGIMEICS